jgi:F-type H+-transporting ATPase subunit b
MKRPVQAKLRAKLLLGLMAAAAVFAQLVFAQEAFAQEAAHEKTKSGLSPTLESILLWVNFAILVAGLTYLVRKYGNPFLAARSHKITQDIEEAARVRKDAEARSAEVDRRLANLAADLAALRVESQKELEAQRRHAAERSAAEMAKIQVRAEQEIAAAGKLARLELKRYSAGMALTIAAQKIQARMTSDTQDALVRGFVKDLDRPSSSELTELI